MTNAIQLLFLFLYLSILVLYAWYRYTWLPSVQPATIPSSDFSEERSMDHLTSLVQYGVHPVGSIANEVYIPKMLLDTIYAIQKQNLNTVLIEIDVQKPSGSFGLHFLSPFQNIYANITNIIVRLSSIDAKESVRNTSLLLSAHYDSAFGAVGASDDGAGIAILLELLRNFATTPPKHFSLLFNFNGAEETILQASHGFITQHPWKNTLKGFLNLEGAGAGGRELLFQTGSDTLLRAYARGAKYPHANTVAQELFESGIIPSQTDYIIYQDYGHVPGMDLAFIANGYVYHTSRDDLSQITPGSIQRFGDNLHGTIRELDFPNLVSEIDMASSNIIHFDIMGYFMFILPRWVYQMFSILVILFSIRYCMRSPLSLTQRWTGIQIVACTSFMGFVTCLLVSILLCIIAPIAWYSSPVLAVWVFLSPTAWGALTGLLFGIRKCQKWSKSLLEQAVFEGYLIGWMFFLLLTVLSGCSLMLTGCVFLIGPLAVRMVFPLLKVSIKKKEEVEKCHDFQLVPFCLSILFPWCHFLPLILIVIEFFVPLMGRTGTTLWSDVFLGFIVCLLSQLLFSPCVIVVQEIGTLQRMQRWMMYSTILSVLICLPRNPYTYDHPKRVYLNHVERTFHLPNGTVLEDKGIWVFTADARGNGPLLPFWKNLFPDVDEPSQNFAALSGINDHSIYGNMPWILPVKDNIPIETTWYLKSEESHEVEQQSLLTVLSANTNQAGTHRTLHFQLDGSKHMTMFIDARKHLITSWSIGGSVNVDPGVNNEVYFLHFSSGESPSQFHFWVETTSLDAMGVAFAANYCDETSSLLNDTMSALPSYMDPIGCLSTWMYQVV